MHMWDTFYEIHSKYICDTSVSQCIVQDTLDTYGIHIWILYLPLGARIRPRYRGAKDKTQDKPEAAEDPPAASGKRTRRATAK